MKSLLIVGALAVALVATVSAASAETVNPLINAYEAQGMSPSQAYDQVAKDEADRAAHLGSTFTGDSAGYVYSNGQRVGKVQKYASLNPSQIYDQVAKDAQARACSLATVKYSWCQ